MKLISKIMVAIILLSSFTPSIAKIKNTTTDPSDGELVEQTVKIYGNCGMCKKTIEKAGNLNNIATVDWNVATKIATLTYDAKKTNQEAILKRIALSGYDSDTFLAPDNTYSNLPECCQYDRVTKVAVTTEVVAKEHSHQANYSETVLVLAANQLKAVFDNYFAIKDALVKTDGNTAFTKASALLVAINAVKMETLNTAEHTVWMRVLKNTKDDAKQIAATKDTKKQRSYFDTLSKNIYDLIKVSKQATPTYLQHCPMANDGKGADWLSKETTIKNPYYGSTMLSCGKVTETIK
jgi:copper chaperone CopZ